MSFGRFPQHKALNTMKKCDWCEDYKSLEAEKCLTCRSPLRIAKVDVIFPSFWEAVLRKTKPIVKEFENASPSRH